MNFSARENRLGSSNQLYVLPAGHYRSFSTDLRNIDDAFKTPKYSVHVQFVSTFKAGKTEVWNVHEMKPGFYFYRGKVFHLPEGLLITPETPHVVKPLAFLAEKMELGNLKLEVIFQAEQKVREN